MSIPIHRITVAVAIPGLAFAAGWRLASHRTEEIPSPPPAGVPAESHVEPDPSPATPSDPISPKVIKQMAASDPARAAGQLAKLQEHQTADATLATAAHWAASDPAAAMAWIASLPPSDLTHKAKRLALCIWSDVAPAGAMAHFADLPKDEQQEFFTAHFNQLGYLFDAATGRAQGSTHDMSTLGAAMLQCVPIELADPLLAAMEASESKYIRGAATRKRAALLFASDPQAAIRFAKEHGIADSMLATAAREAPQRAFELSQQHGISAKGIIYQWSASDPKAARAAVAQIAEPRWRAPALDGWRERMLASSPELVAQSYLDPNDEGRTGDYNRNFNRSDHLRKAFEGWFLLDPEMAIRQAATLTNATDRKAVVGALYRRMKEQGTADSKTRLIELGFGSGEVEKLR